jgi:hypothetical protein
MCGSGSLETIEASSPAPDWHKSGQQQRNPALRAATNSAFWAVELAITAGPVAWKVTQTYLKFKNEKKNISLLDRFPFLKQERECCCFLLSL